MIKQFLTALLFIGFFSGSAISQTIYTLSSSCTDPGPGTSCNWSSGSSWVGGVAPTGSTPSSGDIIVIPENTFVQIEEEQILINNDVEIHVFGDLYVYSKGSSIGNLTLATGSVVKIATTGDIQARQTGKTTGGAGNADKNFLTIGAETIDGSEINGLASPNQVTEGTMASGNAGCAETGTCEADPLPIELADFNLKATDQGILVTWITATEENNDYFEIFRSKDGVAYTLLTKVDGAGNSTETKHYHYLDKTPIIGNSYYKLRQTDFDGKNETFPAKYIQYSTIQEFTFTPNPVAKGEKLTIYTGANPEEELKLSIINSAGIEIHTEAFKGNSFTFDIEKEIESGIYVLKIESGKNVFIKRLLIK